jgi:hypothetical protein
LEVGGQTILAILGKLSILCTGWSPERRKVMARTEIITDDLDGSHDAQPVKFGWDDIWWELDLAEANRKKLEEALQPFLDKAHPAKVAAPTPVGAPPARRGRPRKEGAGEKIDYASPEHAGEPHRGRVSPEEAAYVRGHFGEVNKRLSDKGMRMIDPADPKMKERYGLE